MRGGRDLFGELMCRPTRPWRYAGIEVMTSRRLPEFDLMYTDS
jgi:hypothetical protein